MPDTAPIGSPDAAQTPSTLMRRLRPEAFSDTADRPLYVLDRPLLEFQLETLTARNEQQRFEIFCRKLCERVICPNIRPQSGPEGGGDGKTDAETYPIADRVAEMGYASRSGPGKETWAFAFSAMKDWKRKVMHDVAGIASTGRSFDRIYFVTSRPARAKDRALAEEQLLSAHGIPVHILDRAWIADEVIENERKDIAHDYLGVGQIVNDPMRLGPEDYSRRRRLDAIEAAFRDPDQFAGMERQMVIEAMLAACLSREIEAPRHETDGRHARAIRLAERHGTERQQLEARHDALWTAFWWFDDAQSVSDGYGGIETVSLKVDHARNLEFLLQLHQLLANAVVYRLMTPEACDFHARSDRLEMVLERMADEVERPNHRLEARTSLAIVRLGRMLVSRQFQRFPEIWAELGIILDEAEGLAEYDCDRLVRLIEAAGAAAGRDPTYRAITARLADFVAKRTSDGEGALILLRQALRVGDDEPFERIRLLGRASLRLAKREHSEDLVEAQQHLALAYRSADLLWAARSSCLFAAAGLAAEGEEQGQIPIAFVATARMWAWISLQLRLVPELLMATKLLRMALTTMPLDDASKGMVADGLRQLDAAFACTVLNMRASELAEMSRAPDALEDAGMGMSRLSLLYALGYEELLRADGSLPEDDADEGVADFFARLKAQPVSGQVTGPLILNRSGEVAIETCVCGLTVDIRAPGSEFGIVVSQALAATIEAMLATLVEEEVGAHTECFRIDIVEHDGEETQVDTDPSTMRAMISWPRSRSPYDFARQSELGRFLIQVASEALAAAFVIPNLKKTLKTLFDKGDAHARVSGVMGSQTSLQRITGKAVVRLDDQDRRDYPPLLAPVIPDVRPDADADDGVDEDRAQSSDGRPVIKAHRRMKVRSVIDVRSWERAGWLGIVYASYGNEVPPVFALHFDDLAAARQIFERWRERFGNTDAKNEIGISIIRGLSGRPSANYAVHITSTPQEHDVRDARTLYQSVHQVKVMEPANDLSLSRFLEMQRCFAAYLIAPAVTVRGRTEILTDLTILKRLIPVVHERDVKANDLESVALDLVARR